MCALHDNHTKDTGKGAAELLAFLCLNCGKGADRLFAHGSCRRCLRDDGLCLGCGEATDDDGDAYCQNCVPSCTVCGESTQSPNHRGECDDCVDAGYVMGSGPDGRTTCQTWRGGK